MRKSFLVLFMALPFLCFGQKTAYNWDYRVSAGYSLLGTGDMQTFVFQNEVNKPINSYFSTSVSLALGQSGIGVSESASFVQSNVNLWLSPFKNTGKTAFRIGAGLSAMRIHDITSIQSTIVENELFTRIDSAKRNALGVNLGLDLTQHLGDKCLLNLRLFSQPYFNGDINSGLTLGIGRKF